MRCLLFALSLVAGFGSLTAAPVNLAREMVLTPPSDHSAEDVEIVRWQQRAGAANGTVADFERLGWAFVSKARRTLDAGCFELALKTSDVMDAQFGASDGAAFLRGHALHNLHRFAEAETVARRLAGARGAWRDYALLSDALVEQGKVDEAIGALQEAANLKPGAEIDTRIAHIRWLRGDLVGAIAAMERAVRETASTDHEPMAWMLTQLCGFELERKNVDRAATLADAAAKHVPDFPPALLAQGRVALARGDIALAVSRLRRAATLNPLPDYQWMFADALRLAGANAEAARVEQQIAESGVVSDPRTAALFLATAHRDLRRAVELCRQELRARADVQTHDALAWAFYNAGELAAAAEESRSALTLGTADSRLRLHAAIIAEAVGNYPAAVAELAKCEPAALRPSERALYRDAVSRRPLARADDEALPRGALCRP
jgi:tetratricopeptide (TPR) repeat protein